MTAPPDSTATAASPDHVGVCSDCGTPLPRSNVVIVYETEDGWARVAVCPECRDLAHAPGALED